MKKITKINGMITSVEKFDQNGNLIFRSDETGCWKWQYDEKGNKSYYEDPNGFWEKWEYDESGNQTYYENSNKCWEKRKYNQDGLIIEKETPFCKTIYEYED